MYVVFCETPVFYVVLKLSAKNHHAFTILVTFSCHQRVRPTLAQTLPSPRLHCTIRGRKAHLPLQICAFLSNTGHQDYFAHFQREVAAWPKKLCKSVPRPAVLPSWNCASCNPNSQQPNWTVYCIVPIVIQSPNSPECALCSLSSQSLYLPFKIVQPS